MWGCNRSIKEVCIRLARPVYVLWIPGCGCYGNRNCWATLRSYHLQEPWSSYQPGWSQGNRFDNWWSRGWPDLPRSCPLHLPCNNAHVQWVSSSKNHWESEWKSLYQTSRNPPANSTTTTATVNINWISFLVSFYWLISMWHRFRIYQLQKVWCHLEYGSRTSVSDLP